VEEAELAVLAGGSRALAQSPTIICEVAGQNTGAVWNLLNARGYAIQDGDLLTAQRTQLAAAPFNTLAIPPAGRDRAAAQHRSGLNEDGRVPHA
jgi:hypothetical protein